MKIKTFLIIVLLSACSNVKPLVENENHAGRSNEPSDYFYWIDPTTGELYSEIDLVEIVNDTTDREIARVLDDAENLIMWQSGIATGSLRKKELLEEDKRDEIVERMRNVAKKLKDKKR